MRGGDVGGTGSEGRRRHRPAGGSSPGELGARAEALAARYLEERGYRVVARDFRCPAGEADLIARDGDEWVVVEV
ncbi:MAG TPA: YraN family protein, partial [Thermaerobacter sp.]